MDAPPRNPERHDIPRNPDKYPPASSSKNTYPHLSTNTDKNGSTPSNRPQRQSSFLNLALTPLRSQSKQFRQSYENLVALANAQEALKQTRRAVWRDRGEPPVELTSVEECFEHAMRGGARMSFFLSFLAKSRPPNTPFHVCSEEALILAALDWLLTLLR